MTNDQTLAKRSRKWALAIAACASSTVAANASDMPLSDWFNHDQAFLRSTHLIEIQQGSELSRTVSQHQNQGFELAEGDWVGFDSWYSAKWTDVRLSWMTQVTQNAGLIWGLSTGERGEKYGISPSLKLGFIHQTKINKNNTFLTLRGTSILGGALKEKSCTADYGDIGGIQEVNCRLAASTLEPSDTLNYLFNEKPYNRNQISIQFTHLF